MNATITGTAASLAGGHIRLESQLVGAPKAVVCEYRDGASGAFTASFNTVGDKLEASRFSAGSPSAPGSINVDNTADLVAMRVVMRDANGQTVLATVAAGASGSASFAFTNQGGELRTERA